MRTLKINGFRLYYLRRLVKQLNRPGPLTLEQVARIRDELAQRLPPA